jgi:hypothetical protein
MPMHSKLTPAVQAVIVEALRKGATVRIAAAAAGIHRGTLWYWCKKGRKSKRGQLRDFYDALARAQGQCLAECAATVMAAVAAGDTASARWMLERRAGEDYGPPPIRELERRLTALEKHDRSAGLAGPHPPDPGSDHGANGTAGRLPRGRGGNA